MENALRLRELMGGELMEGEGVTLVNTILNNTGRALRDMSPGIRDIIEGFLVLASQTGVFDALTSSRSYRKRSSADEAIHYLQEKSGTLFDPSIVQALTQLPYGDFVQGEKTSV